MRISIFILLLFVTLCCKSQNNIKDYHFEGNISEEVLRNYLSRAVTMAEVCTAPQYKIDGIDNGLETKIKELWQD